MIGLEALTNLWTGLETRGKQYSCTFPMTQWQNEGTQPTGSPFLRSFTRSKHPKCLGHLQPRQSSEQETKGLKVSEVTDLPLVGGPASGLRLWDPPKRRVLEYRGECLSTNLPTCSGQLHTILYESVQRNVQVNSKWPKIRPLSRSFGCQIPPTASKNCVTGPNGNRSPAPDPIPSSGSFHWKCGQRQLLWLGETPSFSLSHIRLMWYEPTNKRKPEHILSFHSTTFSMLTVICTMMPYLQAQAHAERQKKLKTGKGQLLPHKSKIVPESCSRPPPTQV